MKKLFLIAMLTGINVPLMHAQPATQRDCVAQFLADMVAAVEYTAQDARNEQEQRELFAKVQERITRLEGQQARDDQDHVLLVQLRDEVKKLKEAVDSAYKVQWVLVAAAGASLGTVAYLASR